MYTDQKSFDHRFPDSLCAAEPQQDFDHGKHGITRKNYQNMFYFP
jgi:hypothetical protein